jgi:hypothetical protein
MNVRKAVVAAATIIALSGVTGWAQPGRGPGEFGRRRGGPEFRPEYRPMLPRHVVPRPPEGARHIIVGGVPYWTYGGIYYQLGDDGYVVVGAPIVPVLPRHYSVIVIHGVVYYVADDIYYRPAPGGYVVVERPVEPAANVAIPAPEPQGGTITLYVPKKDSDGFAPVTLKKIDGGFLGPQGEFYPAVPPVALLTEMYGIDEILRQTPSDTFFIHVPNRDGETFTRVELTRHKGGFLGPQGEFYPIMPSVAHLAEMYGSPREAAKTQDAQAASVSQEPAQTDDAVVHVQVPKKNGQGTVDVVLKRRDQGYLGPQGEFYPQMPSAGQLAEVYGAN